MGQRAEGDLGRVESAGRSRAPSDITKLEPEPEPGVAGLSWAHVYALLELANSQFAKEAGHARNAIVYTWLYHLLRGVIINVPPPSLTPGSPSLSLSPSTSL
uniref:Uncharacterized protein n=1 Tax=Haptolina brevifila TaxID=156173 RepID=A0A7S2GQW2_9EUKA